MWTTRPLVDKSSDWPVGVENKIITTTAAAAAEAEAVAALLQIGTLFTRLF